MDKSLPKLALVIPCYNEEAIIDESAKKLSEVLSVLIAEREVSNDSYICFVDDGSADNTWALIKTISSSCKNIKAIKFACNFGHQKAIMAGMCESSADIYITLDCDLQDDLNAIKEMLNKYKTNNIDVVYGVRSSRETDTFLKRFTAQVFYKFCSLMGIKSLYDSADYRLVTDNVVKVLRENKEANLYLRALIFSYKFRYDVVYYSRLKRIGGTPKYNFLSSFNLAVNGITSFSIRPIRLLLILSILMFLHAIVMKSEVFAAGSLIMFGIYVVGEYLCANLTETKPRPNYVIAEKIEK